MRVTLPNPIQQILLVPHILLVYCWSQRISSGQSSHIQLSTTNTLVFHLPLPLPKGLLWNPRNFLSLLIRQPRNLIVSEITPIKWGLWISWKNPHLSDFSVEQSWDPFYMLLRGFSVGWRHSCSHWFCLQPCVPYCLKKNFLVSLFHFFTCTSCDRLPKKLHFVVLWENLN